MLFFQVDPQSRGERRAELLAHRTALLGALTVDGTLNLEQRVDHAQPFHGNRRQHGCLAGRLAPRMLVDIGLDKERPSRMRPTGSFLDRPGTAVGFIELDIAGEGVGLENAAIVG
jgi:hypothetical protein